MIKQRTGPTGTVYLLVVTLIAWVASALVGFGLLVMADNPKLNVFLAVFAGILGVGIFYFSPVSLLWNLVSTLYERSCIFKKFVHNFNMVMIETKAWYICIIAGLILHLHILDGLLDGAGAYFDFVDSIVFSNPLPEEPKSTGPINLLDIF